MSCFTPNIPSLREIEHSLQRSRKVIQESMNLSKKKLINESGHLACNKCLVCARGHCSKLSSIGSKYYESPGASILQQTSMPLSNDFTYYGRITSSSKSHIPETYSKSIGTLADFTLKKAKESFDFRNTKHYTTIRRLYDEIDYLNANLRYAGVKQRSEIDKRIELLEEKISDLEEQQRPRYKSSMNSTQDSEEFNRVQRLMEETNQKYNELQKKLDTAENLVKKTRYY